MRIPDRTKRAESILASSIRCRPGSELSPRSRRQLFWTHSNLPNFQARPNSSCVAVHPLVDPGSDEGYLKWKGNSRLDWAWHGFDLGTTVHYLDGFHEIGLVGPRFPEGKKEHYIKQTWFFDVQLSY